jgi:arylsulfatase
MAAREIADRDRADHDRADPGLAHREEIEDSRRPAGVALTETLWLVVALAATVAPLAGCTDRPILRDVVLVTVDTLRPDHLGLHGYERPTSPNLDRWFADAAIYERAYSTDAATAPSVASLLTGLLPPDHRVRLLYQHLPVGIVALPEMLPPSYQSAAFVSNLVLTDEAMGLANRFDYFDDFVDQKEPRRKVFERNATRTTSAALAWLETARDPDRPVFLWVHYIDPHGPYQPPPTFERRFRHDETPAIPATERMHRYQIEDGVSDGHAYVDLYDEEIRYLDEQVGRLLDGYAERSNVDDALVIFTADHGESMMEHERWFTHGYQVYDEIVRVPLWVRGPGVVDGRQRALASGIDVVPTILAFTGVTPPSGLSGVDLRNGQGLSADRVVYAEAQHKSIAWRAAIQGDRKWVVGVSKRRPRDGPRRFYDLARDPGEQAPVRWASDDPIGSALLERIGRDPDPAGFPARYERGRRLDAPKVAPGLADETMEKLRALGYVEP